MTHSADAIVSATLFPTMSGMNSTEQVDEEVSNEAVSKWICQCFIVEGVVGVVGNLLVCFVILRVSFLHNMTNYLLVNLAITDILLCLDCILKGLVYFGSCVLIDVRMKSSVGKFVYCRFLLSGALETSLDYASAYNLCLITLERYVALVHPLQYERHLTARRMKTLIALIWMLSVLFSLPYPFTVGASSNPNKTCSQIESLDNASQYVRQVFTFLSSYLLPLTLMGLAYYKIHVTLKRQAKVLRLQHARAAAYDLVIARQRLVSMLTIVLGALVILWTPLTTHFLLCLHGDSNIRPDFCGSMGFDYFRAFAHCWYYLNSVINPLIYELKYKKFRQGFKAAFGCCHKHPRANRVDVLLVPL